MIRPLLILGSGPHAREMARIVDRVNAVEPTWELLGFVAEKPRLLNRTLDGRRIVGGPSVLDEHPDASVVPESEWWLLDSVPRERFASLVDPSCFVAPSARIGRGCVVFPNGFIGSGAQLADFVFCLSGCIVNHDVVLEERVMLASGATIAGHAKVGRGTYLGQSCTVRQEIRIGARCLVGMGSVVVADVKAGTVVAGNPARVLSETNDAHRSGSGMGDGEFRRMHERS